MLIFDGFGSRVKAEKFAKVVTEKLKRSATVYDSQEQSNVVDPFPFQLFPPIVLVERLELGDEQEAEIEDLVMRFGGTFACT
jgi:hypothetical protein